MFDLRTQLRAVQNGARSLRRALIRVVEPEKEFDFGAFRLVVDATDFGGVAYGWDERFAEVESPLEREIIARFHPRFFIDIGANYGFTALAHWTANPACKVIAVEPSPKLLPYLERNLRAAGMRGHRLVHAICSDHSSGGRIALNPVSSQDNRVRGEAGWRAVEVASVTLDALVADLDPEAFVYVKTDTQGFERQVLDGARALLARPAGWLLRLEFAPQLLRHQGTDPHELLARVCRDHDVVEVPKRPRFRGDGLAELWRCRLTPDCAADFVTFTEAHAQGRGWCDLLMAPKDTKLEPLGASQARMPTGT